MNIGCRLRACWVPFLILMVFFIFFLYSLVAKTEVQKASSLIVQAIPEFSLPELSDPTRILRRSTLEGKLHILHVWASWCGICEKELPLLRRMQQDFGERLVALNYRDELKSGQSWLLRHGDPFSWVIFDPNADLSFPLGIVGTPETLLIDSEAKIRYRVKGLMSDDFYENTFKNRVKQLEAEQLGKAHG